MQCLQNICELPAIREILLRNHLSTLQNVQVKLIKHILQLVFVSNKNLILKISRIQIRHLINCINCITDLEIYLDL